MLSITLRSLSFPEALSHLAVLTFVVCSSPDLSAKTYSRTQEVTNRSTRLSKALSSARSSAVTQENTNS